MDASFHFRKNLAARVAGALGVSLVLVGTGCGGKVVIDAGGGGFGGSGGAGGSGGSGGMVVSSSSGTTTSVSGSSSSGNPLCEMTTGTVSYFLACIQPDSTMLCPDAQNASGPIQASFDVCTCLRTVDTGPNMDPSGTGLCCYDTSVEFVCVVGRALPSESGPVVAPIDHAQRGWSHETLAPNVDGLSADARREIADRWIRDGLFEHASIASFSRLALALLAVSADADLVRDAHLAALDEVRHAKLSMSLASAYLGETVSPRALPLPDALPLGADLTDLAVSSVVEGAVGETLAAVLAAEQAAVAEDPVVRAVLSQIAEDEARHAELAFRVIAFAIAAGGKPVRDAVESAFVLASKRLPEPAADLSQPNDVARAHGFLAAGRTREVFVRAMDDVVLPLGRALCQTPVGHA